ncbi:uncharacterized protein LOC132283213 [Cornus florida]|uniref:uncharacterized protein LOC132283213 n=1 Tax=Cornus florida TaxID=4283 RepID=UPI0028A104D7|nr:uncharacterized protein LOC132283213 [Cornus florida]
MERSICDVNHLDSDVLLPPRKRLLAGLKKQNSHGNSHLPSTCSTSSEFDIGLHNLLRSHLNNPNLSPEEIVEASRSAAVDAVKVARAARAAAEEKAVIAAKAMAAARCALELVATVSEDSARVERNLKNNKMKKHVPVKMLYNKNRRIKNYKTDEELARKLHQAMNSSPRISKYSSTSDSKSYKHKRLKSSSISEKDKGSSGGMEWEENPGLTSNGNGIVGNVDSKGPVRESYASRVYENTSNFNKADRSKMNNGGVETCPAEENEWEVLDDACSSGIKRGRINMKELPISMCSSRDQESPQKELKSGSFPLIEENMGKSDVGNMPLVSVQPSGNGVTPVETTSTWKCQAFEAPACVKQNNVIQS